MAILFFLQAHWSQLLGILAAAATVIGTVRNLLTHFGWISPGTDSKLAKVADVLSFIAEKGKTGLVGLLTLPGLASRDKSDSKPPTGPALALLLAAALGLSGCAHGTSGLRQACTATDTVLTGTLNFTTATMHGDLKALRSQLPALGVAARLRQHEAAFGRALSLFDSMRSTKDGVCALAPAIDAGMKADVAALVSQVVAIAADAEQAVEALRGALK